MDKIKLYLSQSYDELVNKVTWLSANDLIESAKVVLTFVIISTILVFIMDVISQQALSFIYSIG